MEPDVVHKALGSELRQRILLSIAKRDKYLSEIANEIGIAPQTADFHLNMLSEIGLVSYTWKNGKKYYHLRERRILEFLKGAKPIPLELRPKPPHEIVIDAWNDLSKRLDELDHKIEELEGKIDRLIKKK